MSLCKPHITTDSQTICAFCGHCEKQGSQNATCPYETEFMDSSPVLVIGIVCMGIAVVGFLVLAVLAWAGKL